MGFVPPPNFPQTIQCKGVTCIIYKTKDLTPKIPVSDWLAITRSRTEAVTLSRMAGLVSVMAFTPVCDEKGVKDSALAELGQATFRIGIDTSVDYPPRGC